MNRLIVSALTWLAWISAQVTAPRTNLRPLFYRGAHRAPDRKRAIR